MSFFNISRQSLPTDFFSGSSNTNRRRFTISNSSRSSVIASDSCISRNSSASLIDRGSSLTNDLKFLINNQRYSDLEIRCKDGQVLYGCRAILAARSSVLDSMLYDKKSSSRITLSEIDSFIMIIILEFLYTGSISEGILTVENSFEIYFAANYFRLNKLQDLVIPFVYESCRTSTSNDCFPKLFSKAIGTISPLTNNEIITILMEYVARIPLDDIEYGQLSIEALHFLLSNVDRTSFATGDYSILRYAILTSAKEIAPDAVNFFEKRLPTLYAIFQDDYTIDYSKDMGYSNICVSISKKINPLCEYIDLSSIDEKVFKKILLPLRLIPPQSSTDSNNFVHDASVQHRGETALTNTNKGFPSYLVMSPEREFSGNQVISSPAPDLKWSDLMCGPNLQILDDGSKVITTTQAESTQSVRANYLMTNGVHMWDIIVGRNSKLAWIGVCTEEYNFPYFSGSQPNAWVMGLDGYCYNNSNRGVKFLDVKIKSGSKITVQTLSNCDFKVP
ncbi:11783_t:CDS:2 [Acaulospora morrowiae]|uniref:11783_t:CDS:1 n=1 Tax=Acaulospora morrowiae TaxID=94023 RepID=A0A9N8Z2V8_9GLOM|nr:11783_t:CDS:2 [Acaulospora morrowiae]